MSLWSRVANVFRSERLSREIDEELQSHIEEAIEQGRDPQEARMAFGSALRKREETRDARLIAWLDSLRADAIFGWRRLRKTKVTSAAAILSLALAIGSCTSAFRLIDASMLRPLPVAHADRLYALSRTGLGFNNQVSTYESWAYPSFKLMREAAKGEAELIAVSYTDPRDVTYGSDDDMEKAYVQFVSGWMFDALELRPALGRVLRESDDQKIGESPVAVISYDYWTRRFGRDPKVLGKTVRFRPDFYQIVGVGPETFTGTETGKMTDIFVPTSMEPSVARADAGWIRSLVLVKPGVPIEPLRQKLAAVSRSFETERSKGFTDTPKKKIEDFLDQRVNLERAPAGESDLQREYGRALIILGVLVALVLLIACANVANLMTAQAASRAREMALRVSIGAGRSRLIQLVLIESALVAFFAAAIGALFAWWSTPFVVGMINPPEYPVRLALPADWRVLGFGIALTLAVTFLFGLIPACRASSVRPSAALKGGEDPHSRRRLMNSLIMAQVAFCFLVIFVAGLFVKTFENLQHRPLGFSPDHILNLETFVRPAQEGLYWEQVADRVRSVPGVESVAISQWTLLSGTQSNNRLSIDGGPPTETLAFFFWVTPGWLDTMKIHLLDGQDLRPTDTDPGSIVVNEAFVKTFLNGQKALGKSFYRTFPRRFPLQIVGVVNDARYSVMREDTRPVGYAPFPRSTGDGKPQPTSDATIVVRTAAENPLALANVLRQTVRDARRGFRVSNIRTQKEVDDSQTIRERLLALLAVFFAAVALVLGGIGLYGVLNYSVVQRHREIGIRLAIGAPAAGIARLVTIDVFTMVLIGAIIGLATGMASVRYIETLFYQVKATDVGTLMLPALSLFGVALLASLPAVLQAVRIDPVNTLRSE